MIKADSADVHWDPQKKTWRVRIRFGEEAIKRPAKDHKIPRDAADEALRNLAVQTARGDGYELDPATITISR
ncbi:MAG: hypothetical protein ACM3S5_08525 [Rhodospirillales bacterium]